MPNKSGRRKRGPGRPAKPEGEKSITRSFTVSPKVDDIIDRVVKRDGFESRSAALAALFEERWGSKAKR